MEAFAASLVCKLPVKPDFRGLALSSGLKKVIGQFYPVKRGVLSQTRRGVVDIFAFDGE
jgi:hypothetical protein